MNKMASLVLISTFLAGCASQQGQQVTTEQDLINQHFVLQSVNDKPLSVTDDAARPELNFAAGMHISGNMCNRFSGQASLTDGQLKAPNLAMTRMLCSDEQLNNLDNQFGQMLAQGVKVTLVGQQLTLSTPQSSLTYKMTKASAPQ